MAQQNKDTNELIKVRRQKLADLQAAGKNPFEIMKYDVTHHSKEIKDNFEELEGKEVAVAGRLMFKRVMGKASFCNVQDLQGGIQAYVARDEIGVESYQDFKKMDIGDIVGIKGTVFRTKMGEISVHAESIVLLSKSLQILPEKFHGLTNTDIRYRQRYVDLIMNEDVKETFIKRSKIIKEIRSFLAGNQRKEIRRSRIGIHMLFDQFHRFRQKSHSQHSACFPPTISKDISVYIMFFQISKIDERHTTQQKH